MIRTPINKSFFLRYSLLSFALFFFSCSDSPVFQQGVEFENGFWEPSQIAEFKVNIENPEKSCDVSVDFENTKDYLSSNIWLLISILSPSGKNQSERVEFFITDDKGKWLGEIGRHSVENKFLLKKNIRFPEKGIYIFKIAQIMRENFTPRALSVGISIEDSKKL